jgi:predicted DNA-binding protein (UPF0251 family)
MTLDGALYHLIQHQKERRSSQIRSLDDVERKEIERALRIRDEKGLTLKETAARLGISKKTLWQRRKDLDMI